MLPKQSTKLLLVITSTYYLKVLYSSFKNDLVKLSATKSSLNIKFTIIRSYLYKIAFIIVVKVDILTLDSISSFDIAC